MIPVNLEEGFGIARVLLAFVISRLVIKKVHCTYYAGRVNGGRGKKI